MIMNLRVDLRLLLHLAAELVGDDPTQQVTHQGHHTEHVGKPDNLPQCKYYSGGLNIFKIPPA